MVKGRPVDGLVVAHEVDVVLDAPRRLEREACGPFEAGNERVHWDASHFGVEDSDSGYPLGCDAEPTSHSCTPA